MFLANVGGYCKHRASVVQVVRGDVVVHELPVEVVQLAPGHEVVGPGWSAKHGLYTEAHTSSDCEGGGGEATEKGSTGHDGTECGADLTRLQV